MKTKLSAKRRVSPTTSIEASAATNNRPVNSALNLKRIMVPVDFSGCSKKALQYAVSLAQDYHASVDLIHIVEGRAANPQIIRDRERELETLAQQESRGRVPITTLVKAGETLREIIKVAEAGIVDLLLISTHARAGLPDFCLGSAAEQIVRYAPCPVLVVREQEHDFLRERRPSRDPKPNSKKMRG